MADMTLRSALEDMARQHGVAGCALLETDSGMVWGHVGTVADLPNLAEAAIEYWRLYNRLEGQFAQLGPLQASVIIHAQGRITLLPCGRGLVLLAITDPGYAVDWAAWQTKAHSLAGFVDRL